LLSSPVQQEDTHTNDKSYMMYEKFGPIAQYAERCANRAVSRDADNSVC